MNTLEAITKKEYQKIDKRELTENDRSELETYVNYLAEYCKYVGIEDKPQEDEYSFDLKSFFGTYKFESSRTLDIKLDPKKISEPELDKLLDEIVQWLAILGPNLRASLEMLDPFGMDEFELSFSVLLNELTSNILKEYLPPALQLKEHTSFEILGSIKVPETLKNLFQGEFLFTSERAKVNLESLPVLFLIRTHYEMLSALNRSITRIEGMMKTGEPEDVAQRKPSFALLREVKRNKAYHIELLSNPLYAQLLEKALETDFDDPNTLDKVRKEASTRRAFLDILYLWDAYTGKKAPKPQVKDVLGGGYTFKPASKLYELWTLKALCDVLSDLFQQKGSAQYEKGEAFFSFVVDEHAAAKLIYNSAKLESLSKIEPQIGELRPDFVLTLKTHHSIANPERVLLIADAKYRPKPEASDLERMLAYMLTYCWTELEETANGLFIYIGTNDSQYDIDTRYRMGPDARIYSLCLRPNNAALAKGRLKEIIQNEVLETITKQA